MPNFGTCLTVIDLDGSKHVVTRSGLLYAYGDKTGGVPLTILQDAWRIPDFGRNLKRPAAIFQRLAAMDYQHETRYDAGHGRRYMVCAYPNARRGGTEQHRRVTLAAADGITDLRQYQIDCGVPESDLPALVENVK